jgi:uncharacterized protein YkwD
MIIYSNYADYYMTIDEKEFKRLIKFLDYEELSDLEKTIIKHSNKYRKKLVAQRLELLEIEKTNC